MKRTAALLSILIAAAFCGGCSARQTAPAEEPAAESTAVSTTVTEQTEQTTSATAEETTVSAEPERESHFTFQPKVCSEYMKEVFGETRCTAWYNMVDAMMAGEKSFACPDKETYDWVTGQFPHLCFPVTEDLITTPSDPDHPVKDGIGYFEYAVPQEEFQENVRQFAEKIEGILNETVKETDTDFEKAYALYRYFSETYSYDYEAFNLMQTDITKLRKLTACHVFDKASGICCELAAAYSYLLMQAGVDATVMMGGDHEWSYVRINGKNYHIDTTYALNGNSLAYFMMNDAQRESSGYDRNEFVITSCYSQLYDTPVFTSDDDTFSLLWDTDYEAIDRACKTLSVKRYDWESDKETPLQFSYQGY